MVCSMHEFFNIHAYACYGAFENVCSFHFGRSAAFDAKITLSELVLKLLIAKICIYKILVLF
jgi:hypothetical protein